MLLVNHYVGRSMIHGLGVFTHEPIRAGDVVWRFDPNFDVEIPAALIDRLSQEDLDLILHHAEYIEHLGVFRLGNDGDMFMNHSDAPSLLDFGNEMKAAFDIVAGTELTCSYFDVCVLGFMAKKPKLSTCAK
ncbi:hypothetical protein P775_16630 [Puniceibacterium antarcticum]|uniref:SET domain-containing protein n=1 Tax=Puniceibacterium antarcticum TaxID=1206336 RepID=A0A2G8RD91_9RHOB|nr:SET domain-containing protein [Puniceibacterium antarcticum]PIL19068.1 hypothetical protein P775_16630 [Puniceibacterium antarcticum]